MLPVCHEITLSWNVFTSQMARTERLCKQLHSMFGLLSLRRKAGCALVVKLVQEQDTYWSRVSAALCYSWTRRELTHSCCGQAQESFPGWALEPAWCAQSDPLNVPKRTHHSTHTKCQSINQMHSPNIQPEPVTQQIVKSYSLLRGARLSWDRAWPKLRRRWQNQMLR